MSDDSVPVKYSTITWILWMAAGLLLLMGTVHLAVQAGPAPWFEAVAWWALYLVTAAAVWTVQRMIRSATRMVMARLDRLESHVMDGAAAPQERLRSLRQL